MGAIDASSDVSAGTPPSSDVSAGHPSFDVSAGLSAPALLSKQDRLIELTRLAAALDFSEWDKDEVLSCLIFYSNAGCLSMPLFRKGLMHVRRVDLGLAATEPRTVVPGSEVGDGAVTGAGAAATGVGAVATGVGATVTGTPGAAVTGAGAAGTGTSGAAVTGTGATDATVSRMDGGSSMGSPASNITALPKFHAGLLGEGFEGVVDGGTEQSSSSSSVDATSADPSSDSSSSPAASSATLSAKPRPRLPWACLALPERVALVQALARQRARVLVPALGRGLLFAEEATPATPADGSGPTDTGPPSPPVGVLPKLVDQSHLLTKHHALSLLRSLSFLRLPIPPPVRRSIVQAEKEGGLSADERIDAAYHFLLAYHALDDSVPDVRKHERIPFSGGGSSGGSSSSSRQQHPDRKMVGAVDIEHFAVGVLLEGAARASGGSSGAGGSGSSTVRKAVSSLRPVSLLRANVVRACLRYLHPDLPISEELKTWLRGCYEAYQDCRSEGPRAYQDCFSRPDCFL